MTIEKLIIKNFAGLDFIEIEIKKINILIGPQASGKSIIVKILFYCKNLIDEIFSQGIKMVKKPELDKEIKNKFQKYFPSDSWENNYFSIKYFINNEYIEIENQCKTNNKYCFSIKYSDFYKESFYTVRKTSKLITKNITQQDNPDTMFSRFNMISEYRKRFLQEISDTIGQQFSYSQLFIPAGRSFFAHLQNNIFSLLSENSNIDPFLVDFGEYYDTVKGLVRISKIREDKDFKSLDIDSLKNKILVGQYIKIKEQDYLKMSDGRQIQLSHCSSGQQEALPLTLILESIPFFGRGLTGKSVYIEEPEAHLFPTAQKDIVDLIATVYNFRRDQLQFFITTHSPYILTSFNNLLQAGILAKDASKDTLKKITKIVPNSRFLNGNEIAVYSLLNGGCNSVISEETGLIDAEIIDSVSQDLAIQFENLLEIE